MDFSFTRAITLDNVRDFLEKHAAFANNTSVPNRHDFDFAIVSYGLEDDEDVRPWVFFEAFVEAHGLKYVQFSSPYIETTTITLEPTSDVIEFARSLDGNRGPMDSYELVEALNDWVMEQKRG